MTVDRRLGRVRRAWIAEAGNAVLVKLSRNFGMEVAMSAGLDYARGEYVVLMHADLQDPPELIPEMVARAAAGADVVYARRIGRDESIVKRALATAFYALMRRLARVPYQGQAGDFRLIAGASSTPSERCRSAGGFSAGWSPGSASSRSRSSTAGPVVAAAAAPRILRCSGSPLRRSRRSRMCPWRSRAGSACSSPGQRGGRARHLRAHAGRRCQRIAWGVGACSRSCFWGGPTRQRRDPRSLPGAGSRPGA